MAQPERNVRDAVIEKRIKQIYELLDGGNMKKAISEADKILKKSATCYTVKALKALAFVRLRNHNDDAYQILNELKDLQLVDDYTLQAMTFCYLDMRDYKSICEIYEKAFACDPGNEELGTHLFMAYVRAYDFVGQKKVATQLHRSTRKPIYLFWSATSVLLQALAADANRDAAQRQTLAMLARKMLETRIADAPHRFDSAQEMELYFFALRLLGDFHNVYLKLNNAEFLKGMPSPHHLLYTFEAFYRLRMIDELHVYVKSLLIDLESGTCRKTHIERWEIWQIYITTGLCMIATEPKIYSSMKWSPLRVLKINEKPPTLNYREGRIQPTLKEMFETIQGVHEENLQHSGSSVAAFLSELHIALKFQWDPYTLDVLAYQLDQMIFYACCYFGKNMCTADYLKPFIAALKSIKQRLELGTTLLSHYASENVFETFVGVRNYLTALQVVRQLGHHLFSKESDGYELYIERAMFVHGFAEFEYKEGYRSKQNEKFDQDVLDTYALLAAHYCYDDMFLKRTSASYMRPLEILHQLLSISPKNYNAKLLCIKLYHFLGCGEIAHIFYKSLDIKQFQLDSLSYVHSIPNSHHGKLKTTQEINEATINMFESSEFEVLEDLTYAYKHGTYSKIFEFMNFRDKLRFSTNLLRVTVNQYLLECCLCSEIEKMPSRPASLDTFETAANNTKSEFKTFDNQDYDVLMHWNPQLYEAAVSDKSQANVRLHDEMLLVVVSRLRFSAIVKLFADVYNTSDHSVIYEMCHGSGDRHLKACFANWMESLHALNACRTIFDEQELTLHHGSNMHVYRDSKSKLCVGTMIEYLKNLATFLTETNDGGECCTHSLAENHTICDQLTHALLSIVKDFDERCVKEPARGVDDDDDDDVLSFTLAKSFKERFAIALDIFEYTSVVLLAMKLTRRLIQYVAGNRKSKKERKSIAQTLRDNWAKVHKSCTTLVQDLLNKLAKWRLKFACEELRTSVEQVFLQPKKEDMDPLVEQFNCVKTPDIRKAILQCRQNSIEEVEVLLKEKLKVLNRLGQEGQGLLAAASTNQTNNTSSVSCSVPTSLWTPWNQYQQSRLPLCSFHPKMAWLTDPVPFVQQRSTTRVPDDGQQPSSSKSQATPALSSLPDTVSEPFPLSPETVEDEVKAVTKASETTSSTVDAARVEATQRPIPPTSPSGLVSDREPGSAADDERS